MRTNLILAAVVTAAVVGGVRGDGAPGDVVCRDGKCKILPVGKGPPPVTSTAKPLAAPTPNCGSYLCPANGGVGGCPCGANCGCVNISPTRHPGGLVAVQTYRARSFLGVYRPILPRLRVGEARQLVRRFCR